MINILPESRSSDLFEAVVKKIDLNPSFDFKLYIQTNYGLRAIENDEIVWNLLVEKNHISVVQDKITSLIKKSNTNT